MPISDDSSLPVGPAWSRPAGLSHAFGRRWGATARLPAPRGPDGGHYSGRRFGFVGVVKKQGWLRASMAWSKS